MIENKKEFDRKGNLRSVIDFSWCGEIYRTSVRGFTRYVGEDLKPIPAFSLEIEDKWGFKFSIYREGLTISDVQYWQQKLPYGITIRAEGSVGVRKGGTFFNADRILFPDGQEIISRFIFQRQEEAILCENDMNFKEDLKEDEAWTKLQ